MVYGTEEALAETPPWQGGGNMIADVTIERAIYQGLPNKFEAGTGNIADAVGLGEALRYVEKVGIERIAEYEHALLEYATPRLAEVRGVRLIRTAEKKASVLSFVLAATSPSRSERHSTPRHRRPRRASLRPADPSANGRRDDSAAVVRLLQHVRRIDVFIEAMHRIAEGGARRLKDSPLARTRSASVAMIGRACVFGSPPHVGRHPRPHRWAFDDRSGSRFQRRSGRHSTLPCR